MKPFDDAEQHQPLEELPPSEAALISSTHLPAALVARLLAGAPLPRGVALRDGQDMVRGMLLSHSLGLVEKDRVLSHLPTLSAWQVRELRLTFDDEVQEFTQLVPREFDFIAELQARSLWALAALTANRADTRPALERAWRRRLLRRAARDGLRAWLDTLDHAWWRRHAVARWAYRDLYEPAHPAWVA